MFRERDQPFSDVYQCLAKLVDLVSDRYGVTLLYAATRNERLRASMPAVMFCGEAAPMMSVD